MGFNSIGVFGGGVQDSLEDLIVRKMKQAEQDAMIANAQSQRALQERGQDVQLRGQDQAHERYQATQRNAVAETAKKDAEAQQVKDTARNQGFLRAAIQGSQNVAGTGDPTGAAATRGALRVALGASGAEGKDIPQEPEPEKPTTKPLFRVGRDGRPTHMGDLPANAVTVNEPAPQQAPQPRDERLVQVQGPNGQPIWVRESEAVGKPAMQAPRAVTGAERGVLAYYNRAKDASETLAAPGKDGVSLEDRVAKSGLASQLGLQYAPNILQNRDQQAYRQAQRTFTEARLRKESGAAIPTAEYENDSQTYFAQPGDKPEVIEQKRKKRQAVLDGLKFSSGRAYQEFYGDEDAKPAKPGGGDPLGIR